MNNYITTNKLEQDMKAKTIAKRTIVPHEETRLTMKHAPQNLTPFFTKPRTNHRSLKIDSENLFQSTNPSYENYK